MARHPATSPLAGAASCGLVRKSRAVSFFCGFFTGLVANLAVIAVLWYLKVRDTSVNPWETLTVGAFVAGACVSPTQFILSGVLAMIRRTRPLAGGLVVANALGFVALAILLVWSNRMAVEYGEAHHLALAPAPASGALPPAPVLRELLP